MNLLGNMLREWNRWNFDRLDVSEIQQLGASNKLRSINLRIAERDVDINVVERSACQFACNVITDSGGIVQIVKTIRFLDHKNEVVLEVGGLSLDEVRGRCSLVILAAKIDVLGCSRLVAKPIVEGQSTLEDPIIGRDHQEPG